MSNQNGKPRGAAGLEWLVVLLFFCGVAAITIGLWRLHVSAGLIFLGASALYLAGCVSLTANTSRKDGKK